MLVYYPIVFILVKKQVLFINFILLVTKVIFNLTHYSQGEAASQDSKANVLSLRKPYFPVSYYKSFAKEIA